MEERNESEREEELRIQRFVDTVVDIWWASHLLQKEHPRFAEAVRERAEKVLDEYGISKDDLLQQGPPDLIKTNPGITLLISLLLLQNLKNRILTPLGYSFYGSFDKRKKNWMGS